MVMPLEEPKKFKILTRERVILTGGRVDLVRFRYEPSANS